MKARAVLAIASFVLLVAVACAPGAGAENPPDLPGSVGPGNGGQSAQAFPTSTPWPRFGPPPVTVNSITATVQAGPNAPDDPPSPVVTPTAVAATGTQPPATSVPASPTPARTPTPLDDSGTFAPVMPYQYSIPLDWVEVTGDDEIVLTHRTRQAQVTVRERSVDRALIESIVKLAQLEDPVAFVDWNERSLFDISLTGEHSLRFEYAGTKLDEPQIAVVDWYLWGELLIEVVTESEASAWALDTNLHNTAQLVAASFAPDESIPLVDAVAIENQLRVLFNQKPSNIFVDSANGAPQFELSCKQVLLDVLSEPVYVGSGEWQVFAVTQQGAQVWQVFEPTLNITAATHNTSNC